MKESEVQRAINKEDTPNITTNGAGENFDIWYCRAMWQIQRDDAKTGKATMPQ